MENLGERIRKLRKEQKLTLEALAGDRLTKGMLSLIENGKAKPSMDSLTYIAERLGIETNELLEEVSPLELRTLLEQVEEIYRNGNWEETEHYLKIVQMIEPYIERLPVCYESARLLDLYTRSSYYCGNEQWKETFSQSEKMYKTMNLINQLANLFLFRATTEFIAHRYETSLQCILTARKEIANQLYLLDHLTILDLDYHESVLYYAIGDQVKAKKTLEKAIAQSKEKRIFYRIDDLYRLACFQGMMDQNQKEMNYYLKKLKQYRDFADHPFTKVFIPMIQAHYYNSYVGEYELADQFIEEYLTMNDEGEDLVWMSFYYLEKGKAAYGLHRYEEAIELFSKFEIPSFVHHPFDLSMNYEIHAYRALCFAELGKGDEALTSAAKGVELITPMPETPYKTFILDTYEQIRRSISN